MRLKGTPKGYKEGKAVAAAYRKFAAKHGIPGGRKKRSVKP